jgi:hypothetical protein
MLGHFLNEWYMKNESTITAVWNGEGQFVPGYNGEQNFGSQPK